MFIIAFHFTVFTDSAKLLPSKSLMEYFSWIKAIAQVMESLQHHSSEIEKWRLADLTLGLYKLALKHSSDNITDTIDGELVRDRSTVCLYNLS
jgi:hypothetical protein